MVQLSIALRSRSYAHFHEGYASSIAGGLTTALILPGSANAIGVYLIDIIQSVPAHSLLLLGGQAFVIKLRPTSERSSSAMLLEPPFNLNRTREGDQPLRWRHMKYETDFRSN